ncbi:hypothetical protein APHAL10511_002957 [Amanita phalloides]|nr:hypothetical protein APHAL10511_002957 [Amanita phalloides]
MVKVAVASCWPSEKRPVIDFVTAGILVRVGDLVWNEILPRRRMFRPLQVHSSLGQASARFQSSLSTSPLSSLRGTVQPHNALILLHSACPPPTFPARGPVSQVSKRLQLAAIKWGGVVNWVYDQTMVASEREDPVDMSDGECYSATLFSKHGRRQFPGISVDNVDEVGEAMRRIAVDDLNGSDLGDRERSDNVVQLLVCTHMARDCRCGERGGAFVQRLLEEVERAQTCYGNTLKCTLKIGEVGHVGGHQHAPNLLIYPYGDWRLPSPEVLGRWDEQKGSY